MEKELMTRKNTMAIGNNGDASFGAVSKHDIHSQSNTDVKDLQSKKSKDPSDSKPSVSPKINQMDNADKSKSSKNQQDDF